MTAWPALVLAALAAAGGCPALCPADDLPELPEPGEPLAGTVEAPELEPRAPTPVDPPTAGDPLGLLDEIAQTRLPGEGQPLEPARAQALAAGTSDRASSPGEDREDASHGDAMVDHHGARQDESAPTAAGQRAHEARSWPTTSGERVDEAGAPLAASLLLGLAVVGLYHKLSKERALEHPTRQRILSMLAEDPGLGTTDVAGRLDVCYRTARHHLEVLARFDLVVQAKHRGSWRWARPEHAEAVQEPEVPEIQERVLDLLEEEPGLHLSEIARRLDAAKATVKHHLDRLDERDRVEDERVGPLRRFFPSR